MNDIKNVNGLSQNEEETNMLTPTTDELTGGKFNRYQLAYGTARGARIITNEYVRQRTIAEKKQNIQKDAGGKEAEKPIATMVDPEYRDQKAVRLAISKIMSGEFRLVEREGDVVDVDKEAAKALSEELAILEKQKASVRKDDEDSDDDLGSSGDGDDFPVSDGYTALMDGISNILSKMEEDE